MDEERYLILKMLEEGKITAEEASALIAAMEDEGAGPSAPGGTGDRAGEGGQGAGPSDEEPASGGARRSDSERNRGHSYHHSRRHHRDSSWFDHERFDEAMEDMRRELERVRVGAIDIGDEVSRRVREAMRGQGTAWRDGGPRPFRHFVRNFGDIFNLPFGREMFEEEDEKEMPADPETLVDVRDLAGHVRIEAWDQPRVKIRTTKRVWAGTVEEARERAADYTIFAEKQGQEIRIGARLAPDAPGWLPARCTVDFTVSVPTTARVRVSVTNGEAKVTGVRGGIDIRNTNGAVVARGVSGPVALTTTNGDIVLQEAEPAELRLRAVNGDVLADLLSLGPGDHETHTAHGDVTVSLRPNLPLDLLATTMHGHLGISVPCSVISRSATRLRARLGQAGASTAGEGPAAADAPAGEETSGRSGTCHRAAGVPGLEIHTLMGDIIVRAREEA